MAVTLPYNALLEASEVVRDAISSTSLSSPANDDEINQAIIDVTEEVNQDLDRWVMAAPVVQLVPARHWEAAEASPSGEAYQIWAYEWPVFEFVTQGVTAGPYRKGGQLLYAASPVEKLEYYAGFRRRSQTLQDLQGGENLAGDKPLENITILPPVLPQDIRGAALELILHRLYQAESKQFGTGRRMQQVGGGAMATTEEVMDRQFITRTLLRLNGYRRL